MKRFLSLMAVTLVAVITASAGNVKATLHADQGKSKINKEIYGQFAEHLGSCIYGGLWVGEDSPIPNIQENGKVVFDALKALKVPVLRWLPGGFAR